MKKWIGMPEQDQKIELETTGAPGICPQCALSDCDHLSQTETIDENTERRRKRKQELPPELEEFTAEYKVEELIGEGGMSSVYKVVHRALDQPMALKMLHAHLARDLVQRKRFEQEAQALFRLEHPNIVKLMNFGSTATGKPYLIMDYLEGSSLAEVLKKNGPMPVYRALQLFSQICAGLEHAHSKSMVHRDIKPSNIILGKNADGTDRVRIVDFGIAKLNQDAVNPGLTQTGDVFGSPLYMSPEQCLGHKLDQRSDIYALGCVMYETLSGRPPLSGESALSTIHKHTTEMPKPLQVPDCDPKLRERLDEIIFKTLEKDPDRRYQSVAVLQQDIAELLKDTGYRKGAGYYVRYARFYRHILNTIAQHPMKFAGASAVFIALCSYGAYWIFSYCTSVLQPPAPLNENLAWVWIEQPVEPPPVQIRDQLRKAEVFIEQIESRLGKGHLEVMLRKQKVAKYLIAYGLWSQAIGYLIDARKGYVENYGPGDSRLPDIDSLIGDCFLQQNDYTKAALYFDKALKEYEPINGGQHAMSLTRLKYGIATLSAKEIAQLSATDISKAEQTFAVLNQRYGMESFAGVMAVSGLGDCLLARVETEGPTAADRQANLRRARSDYAAVLPYWRKYSEHDWLVNSLRIADTLILEGRFDETMPIYQDVIANQKAFNDTELAAIDRNYARLLWRTNHWLEAIQMDDEATRKAKASNETLRTRAKFSQDL